MNSSRVKKDLKKFINEDKISVLQSFFKTGKGQYGEGDRFLGITAAHQRIIAKKYRELSFDEISKLLESRYHEHRMTGLLILTYKYEKADEKDRVQIAKFYISQFDRINSWDLVDVTTPKILGHHYFLRSRRELYNWVRSKNMWHRRIAILTTFYFIKQGDFEDTFKIVRLLLNDKEDLIHKSAGWMLREVGKRDSIKLEKFLMKHYSKIPRTMLRYAIEKFPEKKRQEYLKMGCDDKK
jgi:3-methyladenine DNA glycosylase AlkD